MNLMKNIVEIIIKKINYLNTHPYSTTRRSREETPIEESTSELKETNVEEVQVEEHQSELKETDIEEIHVEESQK